MIIIKIDFFYFYDCNNNVIYRCNWEFYNICNNIIFSTISIIKNIFIINKIMMLVCIKLCVNIIIIIIYK